MRRHLPIGLALAFVLTTALLVFSEPPATGPSIRLRHPEGKPARYEVVGLDKSDIERLEKAKLEPEQWREVFAVTVDDKTDAKDRPAIRGVYRIEDGVICFEPRFAPSEGLRYKVVFNPAKVPGTDGKREPISTTIAIPKAPVVPTAVVEQVYPSGDRLPENQLKFYFHFSAPMKQGEAYEHIRLLNEAGKPIELAFLELGEELWDPAGTRFTLFIDPGRIKKGLKPREDLGPVLEEGKGYTLVIDAKWPDAKGNPLKAGFTKKFKAGPAEEKPIDPKAWTLTAPKAGTTEPLVVKFPKPLDHAMLYRVLTVTAGKDGPIAGKIVVTDEERRWSFTPEKAWSAGEYNLVAQTNLEDLAGNKIGRAFEVDVFRPIEKQIEMNTVKLPFTVKR